jgi:hypothetical protein
MPGAAPATISPTARITAMRYARSTIRKRGWRRSGPHRACLAGETTGDPAFDALGWSPPNARSRGAAAGSDRGVRARRRRLAAATEADLYGYCYHVAGAVGVMMALVMGVAPDDARSIAPATSASPSSSANIARDVGEDAAAVAAICRRTGWSKWRFRPAST